VLPDFAWFEVYKQETVDAILAFLRAEAAARQNLVAGLLQSTLILVMKPSFATIVVLCALMLVLVVRREGVRAAW